ncbi:Rieske 2Fe-2S domain-containing protein [Thermomicrobiaceae bacterium CFH 74404]|uniref:Rieske 2Fe-2S domain-containing protein n=1 Tax=Thermalbibacter longus TaxID=2951981 RepID=A0AA41WFR9_9BACT|nr:Rieske 2Fe-2S domain-containing protein [Thermalbibacter longus]MCM8749769.1 Rieske 2Fe-2S domain-containing protein [Thermalbibacter longus]
MANRYVRAARLDQLQQAGRLAVSLDGQAILLIAQGERVYALDNRCPHMGFPLHRGTVQGGILTCHWHHARFDIATGGTFDPWAGDVRTFPVEIRGGEVWVDLTPPADAQERQCTRLREGLERNIPLVIAKAAIAMLDGAGDPALPARIGLEFGTRYRREGWGQGLTILACMVNLLPHLAPEDRAQALYHGLSAVANDTRNSSPRFPLRPLPGGPHDVDTLKRWFRRFIEVRDAEGAERCVVSAVHAGAERRQLADMLFAAITDHRYVSTGHPLDFTNKALEALDAVGWALAEPVLGSLVPGYADGDRMEESNQWRHPVDLVAILDQAFAALPEALGAGRARRGTWQGARHLVPVLLGDDPRAIAEGLLEALRQGATEVELAATVSYAAALRIARFPTSNEFGDWDTALHTFTFANAVEQGLRRAPSPELLRGVFDAAMSVYLDRFLNVPAVRLPAVDEAPPDPQALLDELAALLDRQQQVDEAGRLVARYLAGGGDPAKLIAALGRLLLREDRNFHTIQMVEAAARQASHRGRSEEAMHILVAAARYLAAHAPTVRAQSQTFRIAQRLHRGERLYED